MTLLIVVKTLEKLVHRAVVSALEGQELLSNYQHGFHARQSTVSLLSEVIGHLLLRKGSSVHFLVLDLAKAYSVPRSLLPCTETGSPLD